MPKFSYALSRSLLPAIAALVFTMLVPFAPNASHGQTVTEADTVLLNISGNLTGVNESLPISTAPEVVIDIYYDELQADSATELKRLLGAMNRRTEDYQVAFRSGDTAEINETLDDLSFYWASIRTLHAQQYTSQAIDVLENAYSKIFPFIRQSD